MIRLIRVSIELLMLASVGVAIQLMFDDGCSGNSDDGFQLNFWLYCVDYCSVVETILSLVYNQCGREMSS